MHFSVLSTPCRSVNAFRQSGRSNRFEQPSRLYSTRSLLLGKLSIATRNRSSACRSTIIGWYASTSVYRLSRPAPYCCTSSVFTYAFRLSTASSASLKSSSCSRLCRDRNAIVHTTPSRYPSTTGSCLYRSHSW